MKVFLEVLTSHRSTTPPSMVRLEIRARFGAMLLQTCSRGDARRQPAEAARTGFPGSIGSCPFRPARQRVLRHHYLLRYQRAAQFEKPSGRMRLR